MGSTLFTATAFDIDCFDNGNLSYSITSQTPSTTPALFAINASTGVVTVASSLVVRWNAFGVVAMNVLPCCVTREYVTDNDVRCLPVDCFSVFFLDSLSRQTVANFTTYSLILSTRDGGNQFTSTTASVTVLDVNNYSPVFSNLNANNSSSYVLREIVNVFSFLFFMGELGAH